MCTWPTGEAARTREGFDFYFNECMNGFEYQAAGHMLWEGMLTEGLAVCRAIHDRYHPSRRNPWNEVECGDHYARSMASYGVFLAACGFEYHGPKAHLGFAPRLQPENFRAPFTAAEGWGTLEQKREGQVQTQRIELKHGTLRLRTLAFESAPRRKAHTGSRDRRRQRIRKRTQTRSRPPDNHARPRSCPRSGPCTNRADCVSLTHGLPRRQSNCCHP